MAGAGGYGELRLMVDLPRDGATNMAVDSCLLAAAQEENAATLRLYGWSSPTLSLGYFQRYDEASQGEPALAGLPIVRRVTGGGAIVHADELTYSLSLPLTHPLAGDRPEVLYSWMHRRVAEAMGLLGGQAAMKGHGAAGARSGPLLCFERVARYDLVAGPEALKLAGSAQRRTRAGLLQHGSVVLTAHPAQPSAAVSDLAGRAVTFDELAGLIVRAVEEAGVKLTRRRQWKIDARRLGDERARFSSDAWTKRR